MKHQELDTVFSMVVGKTLQPKRLFQERKWFFRSCFVGAPCWLFHLEGEILAVVVDDDGLPFF